MRGPRGPAAAQHDVGVADPRERSRGEDAHAQAGELVPGLAELGALDCIHGLTVAHAFA